MPTGLFRDHYAIAWDFVVAPDGYFLLEGNTGWEITMPRIITGGLLKQPDYKDMIAFFRCNQFFRCWMSPIKGGNMTHEKGVEQDL